MLDPPALSAAPHNALPMWTDGRSLYTELSSPQGPVVLRYPLTIAGISAALSLIRTQAFDGAGITHTPPEPRNQPGTPAQRDNARAVLRRMRIMG